MNLIVNGKSINSNGYFAYDGCHKIYVTETGKDMEDAIRAGYKLIQIDEIKDIYDSSCPLRFIYNWKLDKTYVSQFEETKW